MVANVLARKTSYYHICYATPDISETLKAARAAGALPIGAPKPALLFGGRLVVFAFTPLGLVEFVEQQ